MSTKEKVLFSWSGGKDSALALDELRRDERYEIVALLTSVAEEFRRVSHHGVREELLHRQAAALGLPLDVLYLPANSSHPCTNEEYEALIAGALAKHVEAGVTLVAHGDIFLEDLREYRERNLARIGLRGLFPLWKRDTTELIGQFIDRGFRARVSCVEPKLGRPFVGREIDSQFVAELPEDVDPCGEYGEYHSYVYAGPIYSAPIPIRLGEIVVRDGRHYADLLPEDSAPAAAAESASMPPVR